MTASSLSENLRALIAALPKVELHLHIEGTLEPEHVMALARQNGLALPYADAAALRRAYDFVDLQSFLDVYYLATSALREEEDFYAMTMAYLRRAHADNVVRAEIFFDPQSHTHRGVAMGTVVGGITRAMADGRALFGITTDLILCFLRHLSAADAAATLELALPHRAQLKAVGLDSSERGHPPGKFAEVFAAARAAGLRVVAHAGEEGPPSYIREALDVLRAERIDHGVRCLEDPALVARLAAEQIPLTVCPLSNVKLRVFESMDRHNLRALLDAGLRVTINSDDPAYFGGYLSDNYEAVASAHGLTAHEVVALARNGVLASFAEASAKEALLLRIDAAAAPFVA